MTIKRGLGQKTMEEVADWLLANAIKTPRPTGKAYEHLKGTGPCMVSHLAPANEGYVVVRRKFFPTPSNTETAHRIVWKRKRGRIPRGKMLAHGCDNPSCINVAHMRCTTQLENMREKVARKRDKSCVLGERDKRRIKALKRQDNKKYTNDRLSRMFGVTKHTITAIINGPSMRPA